MKFKEFFKKISKKFTDYFFNPNWRCLNCGREVFEGQEFCEECLKTLPYNDGAICDHCGRKLVVFSNYCSTCKGKLVDLDKCRSVFNYAPPINKLIKHAKYDNAKYLLDYFAKQLSNLYFQSYFNADYLTFVPMTKKAEKRRGYNQSKLLAEKLCERINVQVLDCLVKTKETKRQATLTANERRKNLTDAFKVVDKKSIKGKSVLIVDDVTTTGATAQILAQKLKGVGATNVYLITVASVPPFDKY
ncbi:MAG: ComF family protein [Clostridiales bacterium]|nr:ComF family protein [Clostridiales bacterium]